MEPSVCLNSLISPVTRVRIPLGTPILPCVLSVADSLFQSFDSLSLFLELVTQAGGS
jgi:hypothetical protein